MKNIYKSKILKALFIFSVGVLALSCDKHEDYVPGKSNLSEMTGDWYIKFLVDDEDIYGLGYQLITTANSADESSLWIDDHSHTWSFKVKSSVDMEAMTFSGSDLESNVDDYEVNVNITKGTILKDAVESTGGNVVDSIYFEAEFSDDPGTIYQFAGYKRTGLAEDEH
ncbi:lipid-binding protein [Flagellimonas sp.]|uniref:lipid-binding protein n=1 Tax=Flagellimonas sp. TaxID=2058762 RepID=UPI003B52C921